MRTWRSFPKSDIHFRGKLLNYSKQFGVFLFLDSCNNTAYGKNQFDYLLAAGSHDAIECDVGNAFDLLKNFVTKKNDWVFGYLGYDLKNEIERLVSENEDGIGFRDMYFFIPSILVRVDGDVVHIGSLTGDHDLVFSDILSSPSEINKQPEAEINIAAKISPAGYESKINSIRQHIIEGDIYELNFCQEFYSEKCTIDPHPVFDKLCDIAKSPFSALLKCGSRYAISSSPERFLMKSGSKLVSMPVKGTIRRSYDPIEDESLKHNLQNSEKDRAENVMIVDLVRNDLARSCETGSVRADELFSIYSFEHVHHMVSAVSGILQPDVHPVDAIRNAFPMGSMTGAPKVRAMELIERYEESRRGLFSGSIGYFTPDLDFDFNVVIRSMFYDAGSKYLSMQAGGAIVYDSKPDQELGECYLKIRNLLTAIGTPLKKKI